MPANFVVTGFGKFCGVEDNPSSRLVDWLQDEMRTLEQTTPAPDPAGPAPREAPYTVLSYSILTVATQDVDEWLDAELQSLAARGLPAGQPLFLLHFGVNSGAAAIHLETQGVNEMTFRCPDERGRVADREPIDLSRPLDAALHTTVDVPALLERLRLRNHGIGGSPQEGDTPVARSSTDAGRFLCNFILWCSLQAAEAWPGGSCHALFVHVPPFEAVPEAAQRRFVLALLEELAAWPATPPPCPAGGPAEQHAAAAATAAAAAVAAAAVVAAAPDAGTASRDGEALAGGGHKRKADEAQLQVPDVVTVVAQERRLDRDPAGEMAPVRQLLADSVGGGAGAATATKAL